MALIGHSMYGEVSDIELIPKALPDTLTVMNRHSRKALSTSNGTEYLNEHQTYHFQKQHCEGRRQKQAHQRERPRNTRANVQRERCCEHSKCSLSNYLGHRPPISYLSSGGAELLPECDEDEILSSGSTLYSAADGFPSTRGASLKTLRNTTSCLGLCEVPSVSQFTPKFELIIQGGTLQLSIFGMEIPTTIPNWGATLEFPSADAFLYERYYSDLANSLQAHAECTKEDKAEYAIRMGVLLGNERKFPHYLEVMSRKIEERNPVLFCEKQRDGSMQDMLDEIIRWRLTTEVFIKKKRLQTLAPSHTVVVNYGKGGQLCTYISNLDQGPISVPPARIVYREGLQYFYAIVRINQMLSKCVEGFINSQERLLTPPQERKLEFSEWYEALGLRLELKSKGFHRNWECLGINLEDFSLLLFRRVYTDSEAVITPESSSIAL